MTGLPMTDFKKTVALQSWPPPPSSSEKPALPDSVPPSGAWVSDETTSHNPQSGVSAMFLDSPTTVHPSSGGPVSVAAQPVYGAPLPPDAPDWARFGRVMSSAIESAILRGEAPIGLRSAMARAWAAWQLGGYTPKQVGTVARLVDRSHRALWSTDASEREDVSRDCATIVYNGLPSDMRNFMTRDRVVEIVRIVAAEPDASAARLTGVAALLGWTDASRAWAGEAIAIAMGEID